MRLCWLVSFLVLCHGLALSQGFRSDSAAVVPLMNGSINVQPRNSHQIPFEIDANVTSATLRGAGRAAGGLGNDIRVLVVRGTDIIYNSGQQSVFSLNLLLNQPGAYRLVLDNTFSTLSQKTVAANVSLWLDRNAPEREPEATRVVERDHYANSPIAPNSKVFFHAIEGLGPLVAGAIDEMNLPLNRVAARERASFELTGERQGSMFALALVEISTGDVMFSCTIAESDQAKKLRGSAESCAKLLRKKMQR